MSTEQQIPPEPDFRFTDVTIIEAEGLYDEAIAIMRHYREPFPWMLRSRVTLVHSFGVAEMDLEFYSDRRIVIISCSPSNPDPLLNFDIRSLRKWADDHGWDTPSPSKGLINASLPFWKHMWQVYAVDCPDFDVRYGARPDRDLPQEELRDDEGDAR